MTNKTYKLESEEHAENLYRGVIDPSVISNLREFGLYKIRGDELHFNHIRELGDVFVDDETVPALDRKIRIINAPSDETAGEIKSQLEREFKIKLVEAE